MKMAKFMIGFSGCKSTIILYFTVHLQQWKWSYYSSFLLFLHQLLEFNMELIFRYRTRSKVVEKSCFLGRRFLLLIEFKFHHTMLVLNAFLAISEGLVSDNQSWNIFLPHLTIAKISPMPFWATSCFARLTLEVSTHLEELVSWV